MTAQNYPAEVKVLTPSQVVARWRELGWGDAAASDLVNEYGVPLHACNGVRQDEHYWKWLEHLRVTGKTRVPAPERLLPGEGVEIPSNMERLNDRDLMHRRAILGCHV